MYDVGLFSDHVDLCIATLPFALTHCIALQCDVKLEETFGESFRIRFHGLPPELIETPMFAAFFSFQSNCYFVSPDLHHLSQPQFWIQWLAMLCVRRVHSFVCMASCRLRLSWLQWDAQCSFVSAAFAFLPCIRKSHNVLRAFCLSAGPLLG